MAIPVNERKQKPNCTCFFCGKAFYLYPCELKAGRGKYCSIGCVHKHMNAHRVEEDIAIIALTHAQETKIDLTDLPLILSHSWTATQRRKGGDYYAVGCIDGKSIGLHAFLLKPKKGYEIDHINHDTLDNRRSNLRIVSRRHNSWNLAGPTKHNKVGVLNVRIATRGQRQYYVAQFSASGMRHTRYFPYTEDGLAEATEYSQIVRAQMLAIVKANEGQGAEAFPFLERSNDNGLGPGCDGRTRGYPDQTHL